MKLDLDWKLNTTEERVSFAEAYIEKNGSALTPSNLDSIAEYILWSTEDDSILLERKNSHWNGKKITQSLDELYERAEETGRPVDALLSETTYKRKNAKLEREEVAVLLGASSLEELYNSKDLSYHATTPQWIGLWSLIDPLEYKVQYWEGLHGKRRADLPIREELLNRLRLLAQKEEASFEGLLEGLQRKATLWSARECVEAKKRLVSHRKEQYQLLDMVQGDLAPSCGTSVTYWEEGQSPLNNLYPFSNRELAIDSIGEEHFQRPFQNKLIAALRAKDEEVKEGSLDLRNPTAVRALLFARQELLSSLHKLPLLDRELTENALLFLEYYEKKANLSPELVLIKEMKLEGVKNREIALELKARYGLSYKENYVSTIFSKRVIDAISSAAREHESLMEYLTFGRSVFKKCSQCNELLPRNKDYFNQRSSTSDGFYSYCRECKKKKKEKEVRNEK